MLDLTKFFRRIERDVEQGKPVEMVDIIIKRQEAEVLDFLEKENKKFLEIKSAIHPFVSASSLVVHLVYFYFTIFFNSSTTTICFL